MERLEDACRIALDVTYSPRYRQLKPILDNGSGTDHAQDDVAVNGPAGFVRGGDYYGKAAMR